MLQFNEINLDDKPIFDRIMEGNNYRSSDLSFTNIFCWKDKFNTQFAIHNDWLFVRFRDNIGNNSYLKPIGGSDLAEAIRMIEDDAEQLGEAFQMRGLTQQMCDEIEKVMPDRYTYNLNLSVSDYIYSSEKLITLSGKKLQSKRNHINRFKNENNWKYRTLTGDNCALAACKTMLEEWIAENDYKGREQSLVYDDIATKLMLDNFELFQLRGGMICADDRLVAFSLGSKLTDDTFDVHVEKATTDTHGAYTIMNQQFVANEAATFKYINREEDLGIESLRKAKNSYQPDILLKKYVARKK